MKDTIVYFETSKGKLPLVFNLNVAEEIQEKYGSIKNWGKLTEGDGEPKIKELREGIAIMINEGIDIENEENGTDRPALTLKQVGRIMTEIGVGEIVKKVQEITIASNKTGDNEGKNE